MFPHNQNNKPSGFNLPQPPQQQQNEWNINNCPWAPSNNQQGSSSGVMQFVGVPAPSSSSSLNVQPQQPQPGPSTWSGNIRDRPARLPRTKRRSESEEPIPAKQYISEGDMITRLSTMRLEDLPFEDDINLESDEETMHQPFPVNLTPQELEQRLKNASRITVIKSVQNSLKQNPELAIPPSLLERMEQPRPNMAVVLWQPPLRFLGQPNASYDQPTSSSEEEDDPFMDANNNNNDPNNNNEVEDMDL